MILQTRHIVAALALHLLLFGFLFSGVQCSRKAEPVAVIQGTLISANQLPRAQAEPKPQPPAPETPAPQPEPVAPPPSPKPEPVDTQREQQALLQKQQAEAAAKEAAKQKAAEVLQKQQADAKAAAQKAADLKKKLDAESEAKKQADELRKATEAEDKKRSDDDKKKKDLKARLDAEAKRLHEAELAEALGVEAQARQTQEISIWGTQLQAALQRAWTRPPGLDVNLKCILNIQLSPTGEVLSARVKTSSGNPLYDDSVVKAAYKASPLPLPRDPTVFQNSININFVPKT